MQQYATAERAAPTAHDLHVHDLLKTAFAKGASDLHITCDRPPVLRIDGEITDLPYTPLTPTDTERLVFQLLTPQQAKVYESNKDLDFSYSIEGIGRFRVNVYQQRGAYAAALRTIHAETPAFEQLGLPKVLLQIARLPRGLVLVTGPTGSGKSTTLAAMVDYINSSRACHIVTIEDPIEYHHGHKKGLVNQREIFSDTQSFSAAMKHVLRQDPDVILVGEMRDAETMKTAIEAAETGHLVFSTLHTIDAPQSVDRIIDSFPPHQQQQIRVQLGGALRAVISQQLLPRMAGSGRVPALEIMIATPAVSNLIRESKSHQIYSAIQTGGQVGMQTMDQALRDLVKRRVISREVALARALNPKELMNMLQ